MLPATYQLNVIKVEVGSLLTAVFMALDQLGQILKDWIVAITVPLRRNCTKEYP